MELTEHGAQLLDAARRVLGEADSVLDLASGLKAGTAGHLRIAFVASALNWGLPPLLRSFREQNLELEITATQMPVNDQVVALIENRIDIGFTLARLTYDQLRVQVISVEPLVAVLPADHPHAGDERVQLGDLAQETFLTWRAPFGPHLDDFITRACAEADFMPRVLYQGPQIHTLANMVAAGFGVSLVPQCDRRMATPGAVFKDLAPPAPWTVLSAVRHRRGSNPIVDRLMDELPAIDLQQIPN